MNLCTKIDKVSHMDTFLKSNSQFTTTVILVTASKVEKVYFHKIKSCKIVHNICFCVQNVFPVSVSPQHFQRNWASQTPIFEGTLCKALRSTFSAHSSSKGPIFFDFLIKYKFVTQNPY